MRHRWAILLRWAAVSLSAGVAVTLALAAGRVEIGRGISGQVMSNWTGAAGHTWGCKVWPGISSGRDAINVFLSQPKGRTAVPPAEDLTDAKLAAIPHAAWREMVRESTPVVASGSGFWNLQAYGLPFPALTGGFLNDGRAGRSWYWEPTVLSRKFMFPLRPVWGGLLIDTVVWAVPAWALLVCGLRAKELIVRRRAASRGLCPSCGYDMAGTSGVCPECGHRIERAPAVWHGATVSRSDVHAPRSVILFDGVCNLCNAWVLFVIRRDPGARFAFAALQSGEARRALAGVQEPIPDTIVLLEHGRVHTRSAAALRILRGLSGAWPLLYALVIIPRPIRDWAYGFIARHRYRWFGERAVCVAPSADLRARFLTDEQR